jgi:hypothetical protein
MIVIDVTIGLSSAMISFNTHICQVLMSGPDIRI